jgi:NAD/NADP transhydrogenase alpha subunit
VTDAVLDEVAIWQNRPLEAVYPLVFFDALRVKVRDEVGAMLAAGLAYSEVAMGFGFLAVILASVNIFGGFLVTQRMLAMFKARGK